MKDLPGKKIKWSLMAKTSYEILTGDRRYEVYVRGVCSSVSGFAEGHFAI